MEDHKSANLAKQMYEFKLTPSVCGAIACKKLIENHILRQVIGSWRCSHTITKVLQK